MWRFQPEAHSIEMRWKVKSQKARDLDEKARGKWVRSGPCSPRFIDDSNFRVRDRNFFKELLRDQKRTVGRLDSRFKGIDKLAVTENIDFDPTMSAIMPRTPP